MFIEGGLGRFLKLIGVKHSLEIVCLPKLIFWGRRLMLHVMYNDE